MTLTSRKFIATMALGTLAASTLVISASGALTAPAPLAADPLDATALSASSATGLSDVALLTSYLAEDAALDSDIEPDISDCGFDVEEWDPTPEEMAEFNDWTAQEKALLDAAGISSTIETDEFGIDYLEWDEADDEAAFEALDALWDDFDFEQFSAEEFDDDWELTPQDIDEINAWTAAEIAALEAAGVDFTVETDEDGIRYPIWDEATDEAAFDALESLWDELDSDEFDDFDEAGS